MHIALGVTGSVAATLTPKLVDALLSEQHTIEVIATASSLSFFDPAKLGVKTWIDNDEWLKPYVKGDAVAHIDIRNRADILVIAPLSANTLAKIANGLCDNLLTCVVRAWNRDRPIILAPAMNTAMWESPFTALHMRRLRDVLAVEGFDICIVQPVAKLLACGDVGVGAMAPIADIVARIQAA